MVDPSNIQTYEVSAHEGDTLDALVHRHKCTHSIDDVSALNPQLIGKGVILERGEIVRLPYNSDHQQRAPMRRSLSLWD